MAFPYAAQIAPDLKPLALCLKFETRRMDDPATKTVAEGNREMPIAAFEHLTGDLTRLDEGHNLAMPLSRTMPSVGRRV